jgi:hypothetical protein
LIYVTVYSALLSPTLHHAPMSYDGATNEELSDMCSAQGIDVAQFTDFRKEALAALKKEEDEFIKKYHPVRGGRTEQAARATLSAERSQVPAVPPEPPVKWDAVPPRVGGGPPGLLTPYALASAAQLDKINPGAWCMRRLHPALRA